MSHNLVQVGAPESMQMRVGFKVAYFLMVNLSRTYVVKLLSLRKLRTSIHNLNFLALKSILYLVFVSFYGLH